MREGSVLKLRVAPERRRAAASNGRWERDFFLARGGVSTCHLTVGAEWASHECRDMST